MTVSFHRKEALRGRHVERISPLLKSSQQLKPHGVASPRGVGTCTIVWEPRGKRNYEERDFYRRRAELNGPFLW